MARQVVDFLDTSVFVELLDVPFMNDHRAEVLAEMQDRLSKGVRFVLPTATIIETGNHVFQVKAGTARGRCARTFQAMLEKTARGEAPWVLHERQWSGEFLAALSAGVRTGMNLAEHAVRQQLGTGDLSIVAERDLYASRAQATVRIGTLEATMTPGSRSTERATGRDRVCMGGVGRG